MEFSAWLSAWGEIEPAFVGHQVEKLVFRQAGIPHRFYLLRNGTIQSVAEAICFKLNSFTLLHFDATIIYCDLALLMC